MKEEFRQVSGEPPEAVRARHHAPPRWLNEITEAFLREPEKALTILGEYPVLARQIVTDIDQWVESSTDFLRDLCVT